MIPLITLEEHFFSSHIKDWSNFGYSEQLKHVPNVLEKLLDLDDMRLQSMDDNSIAIQVISHGPGLGTASPDDCKQANDVLHAAIQRHPKRYAGFAVLPMHDPEAAARELTRCVRDLGFKGALIDNHIRGQHYESPAYHTHFWSAAATLDVPIYLHPTWPAADVQLPQYTGGIPAAATGSISSSGWGWHADVGAHILKLFASGLFDTFPTLKIIAGHMGEMLPYMLQRICILSPRWGPRTRLFEQVYRENIWVTTSGCWSVDPMACLLRNTPLEHVLYSVDYPFARNEDGTRFMRELRESGLVSEEQWRAIGFGNAQKLMGLSVEGTGVGEEK